MLFVLSNGKQDARHWHTVSRRHLHAEGGGGGGLHELGEVVSARGAVDALPSVARRADLERLGAPHRVIQQHNAYTINNSLSLQEIRC